MLHTNHSVGGLPTGGLSVAIGPRSKVRDAFDPRLQCTNHPCTATA